MTRNARAIIRVTEAGFTDVDVRAGRTVTYLDHQPDDGTRYEIISIDVGDALHLGQLGYVSQDAVLIVSGMGGRAYLFRRGQDVAEFYVEEKFGLENPHTVHHITELIARAIGGRVVACDHEVDYGISGGGEDRVLDLADDGPSTLADEPLMDPRD